MGVNKGQIKENVGAGQIRVGIGGWVYEPWRNNFYPEKWPQKRELEYASQHVTSIEINGSFYSTFKPVSWAKWRDETPDDFVFAMKAVRFTTHRKELAGAGDSITRFVNQGLAELRHKLGPINWQLTPWARFDAADMEAFLKLLPREVDGLPLRHALEVGNDSFACEQFYDLARKYNAAIIFVDDDKLPAIDEATADFSYARLKRTQKDEVTGYAAADMKKWAERAKGWAKRGDVFMYFISGAKERNPAAAQAMIERLGK